MCEIPLAIAACPTAAIKPAKVKIGDAEVKSVAVNNDRCMFCGNCYTMCPSMPLADKEGDGIVLMVGGKVSNRISTPKFSKVVVAFLPNEMPRWEQTTATIKRSLRPTPPAPTNTSAWATGPRESAGSGSSKNVNLNLPII
jgi:sulfite reductase beta subunit